MSNFFRQARPWLIAIGFLLLCFAILNTSSSFQSCTQEQSQSIKSEHLDDLRAWVLAQRACLGGFVQSRHNEILAIFTIILAIATIFLWYATRDLVKGAEATAERQLRAYVAHEPNGAHFESTGFDIVNGVPVRNQKGPVKYFEYNVGKTPATNVEMYVCIIPGLDPPPKFDGPFKQIPVMRTVYPRQNIGKVIDPPNWTRNQSFFLYGYIDYSDIFGRGHRRRFAFSHDVQRMARGDDEWIAHHDHNDEIPQPKKP
jgi:hypothetical protein